MEQLLHYVWKHKIFPLKELKTTTGQQVEVIDTGLANTDAGPDFFNAKLKLDGVLWIGKGLAYGDCRHYRLFSHLH